ncbi:histidinol-phosphate transaminase [Neobacillus kokaensis]|uniref:Histidinol-phosphate aminotransferase n=1 Tax=Neobacillus kokaensis TaxID=2759023 RepID=A0ABQ3N260_9BACI|nr:histidinol-phosphate transaminase [Neobacillus kokaensis]GHH99038.1 histidinol-phosphate aminotransferase [Neobacillus kokaensis]
MSKEHWRRNVSLLKPYIPGIAIEDVKRKLGLEEITRLASNENPFGPSPKAVTAMRLALLDSQLYPESSCRALREKLASLFELKPEQFLIGNGADNVISLIGTAYINPGDEIIYCTPTFPAYRTITLLMGGTPIEIPVTKNQTYDLDRILAAITAQTKLIFICNPNNPTGTIVENGLLESFLQRIPPHVIAVLDEAYVEFIEQPGYHTGVDFVKKNYPVIFVRTFSKLYGLAGTRVGYCAANCDLMKPILAVREPFAVNRIAAAGAFSALDDEDYKFTILQENKREMEKLSKELRALGYDVTESHANFLFVDIKGDAVELTNTLMREGVLIRPCIAWGLPQHARITIGTAEQNERLLTALRKIIVPKERERIEKWEKFRLDLR